jgi:hypothetical protein
MIDRLSLHYLAVSVYTNEQHLCSPIWGIPSNEIKLNVPCVGFRLNYCPLHFLHSISLHTPLITDKWAIILLPFLALWFPNFGLYLDHFFCSEHFLFHHSSNAALSTKSSLIGLALLRLSWLLPNTTSFPQCLLKRFRELNLFGPASSQPLGFTLTPTGPSSAMLIMFQLAYHWVFSPVFHWYLHSVIHLTVIKTYKVPCDGY